MPVACHSHCPRDRWRPALPEVTASKAWATPHGRRGQPNTTGSAAPEARGGSGCRLPVAALCPNAPRMPRPFRRGEPASRHRVAVCRSGHSVCLLVIPSWSPESLWGADRRRRDLGTVEETFLGSNPGASVPFVPSFTARPALNRTRRLLLPSSSPLPVGDQAFETRTGGWELSRVCGNPHFIYYILRAPWP